jgi:ribosome biogenesis protein
MEAVPSKKLRGGGNTARASAEDTPVATECSAVLQGHSNAVSGLAWATGGKLYSSSWDHSLKKWDISRGNHEDTMATGKVLLCVAVVGASGTVVASGSADGALRIWDSRTSSSEALVRTLLRSLAP